jgi:hypothetical protein
MSIEETIVGELTDDDPEEQFGPDDGSVFAYGANIYHCETHQEVSCPARAAMSETKIHPIVIRDVCSTY